MPSDNWESVNVYVPLMDEVREIAAKLKYPNPQRYVDAAIREKIAADKATISESSQGGQSGKHN